MRTFVSFVFFVVRKNDCRESSARDIRTRCIPQFLRIKRVDYYFAAASCFTLVWKMAIHAPFCIFQTDPAL